MRYASIVEAFLDAPREGLFLTCWRDADDFSTLTFGDFLDRASGAAMQLRDRGVGSGDRVVLVLPQDVDLMATFAGAMLIGAVPAILAYPNFKVDPAKYRHGLEGVCTTLAPSVVVVDEGFPDTMRDALAGVGAPIVQLERDIAQLAAVPVATSNLAFIQHSAGTTGLQKGVALSDAAVLTQLEHLAESIALSSTDRVYSWLPLYHDMGLIACFMLPLVYHLPLVMQSPTNWVIQPQTMLELITEYRCSLAWVPNFTLQFLARRVHPDDRAALDLSSLRLLVNCSEPVLASSIDEFVEAFGDRGLSTHAVQASYAMAENTFAVTQSGPEGAGPARIWADRSALHDERRIVPVEGGDEGSVCFVSSGSTLPGNEVEVRGDDGSRLGDLLLGHLHIRSDSLFDGYFGRPDLTAEALRDGWYATGDLGFTSSGEVFVVGRGKDLIIQGGKNIHPQDIEEIAMADASVIDGRAVAFGVFNPDMGTQDVVLVAEIDPAQAGRAAEIKRAIRSGVVSELGITAKHVELRTDRWIVKSTAGKPSRSATKAKFLSEHPEFREPV